MYNSTEFNYVIEGRVNDQGFKARAFRLAGTSGWQFQVDLPLRGTVLVGIGGNVAEGPYGILRDAVNRVFGLGHFNP
jgi:hypothetical protein